VKALGAWAFQHLDAIGAAQTRYDGQADA
jgi:hypothetical protein